MSEPVIRPTATEDLAAITAIYADAVVNGTASYELEPPSPGEMAKRYHAVIEQRFPYLVADVGGKVAGYAYIAAFRPRPAYRFAVEDSIYIDPQFRRMGIGRLLLDRLIAEADRLGMHQMIAVIGDGANQQGSIRLHEQAGFSFSGTIIGSGFKHGRWLDTVIMQKPLNGGTNTPPDERF